VNFCSYYSKGVADYIGIWDLDEFFIPKGKNKNLLNVIENAYPENEKILDPDIPRIFDEDKSVDKKWPGGRGWADGHGHPFCNIQLRYVSTYFT
jgi:Glycosyltransferase family 92